jgi:hypothetical protein
MSNKKTKMINRVKKAIAPLTPVLLKDIPRPQTVEEGRANLRRFYGCIDGNLQVLLSRRDLSGNEIAIPNGERTNGLWCNRFPEDQEYPEPHDAVVEVMKIGPHVYVSVDPDKLECLPDLYSVTNSGCFNGAEDPSFKMNLIIGRDAPILDHTDSGLYQTWELMRECKHKAGYGGDIDSWLNDPTVFRLFSNTDVAIRRYGGFKSYAFEKDFRLRWRQMNNQETRYLHWLLLGPFAPYIFVDSDKELAA